MGRVISGTSGSAGGSSGLSSGIVSLVAGEALAKNDLVQIAYDNKAYKVTDGDIAKIANKNSAIIPETTIIAGNIYNSGNRLPVLRAPDGSIFTVNTTSGNAGLRLNKYSAFGALLVQGADVGNNSFITYSPQMAFLPNGNIVVVWGNNNTGQKLNYAIFDQSLNIIKNTTAIGNGLYGLVFGFTVLSAGGFAVFYQDYTTNTQMKLATFDNAGTAVLAATTVFTVAAGTVYSCMRQLSSGDLALVYSNSAGDQGYAIFTTGGAQVKAKTALSAYAVNSWIEIDVIAGSFAIAWGSASAVVTVGVYNNAGAVQGATTTVAQGNDVGGSAFKMINDGIAYYLVFNNQTSSKLALLKIPTTGTGYVTTDLSTAQYGQYLDAYYENGRVGIIFTGGVAPSFSIWTITGVVVLAATVFGSTPASPGKTASVIPGPMFSFVAVWADASPTAQKLICKKWGDTAILGVAAVSAAAGTLVDVNPLAGSDRVNPLSIASSPLSFDHTTGTNIPGNKGFMLSNGVILKGM